MFYLIAACLWYQTWCMLHCRHFPLLKPLAFNLGTSSLRADLTSLICWLMSGHSPRRVWAQADLVRWTNGDFIPLQACGARVMVDHAYGRNITTGPAARRSIPLNLLEVPVGLEGVPMRMEFGCTLDKVWSVPEFCSWRILLFSFVTWNLKWNWRQAARVC